MEPHRIDLREITFDDAAGGTLPDVLKYPVYGNLIEPAVTLEHHGWLQLEPAFQFLDAEDRDQYEFRFELGAGDFYFARGEDGRPIYREAAGAAAPCVTAVYFPENESDLKTCVLLVDPAAWGEARVITLRIFCNTAAGSDLFDPHHGVSLSLIGAGADVAAQRSVVVSPLVGKVLEIAATIVESAGREVPRYSIFQPLGVPPGLSLEPALRVSADRPAATLKLVLTNGDLRFKAAGSGDDEVEMIPRTAAEMPDELSRVDCSDEKKGVHFTWRRSRSRPFLVFGFSLGVERCRGGENGWETVRGFDVDPILFNDPPPGGW